MNLKAEAERIGYNYDWPKDITDVLTLELEDIVRAARAEALDEAAQIAERQVDGYEPGDRGADGALNVASELRRLAKYTPRDPLRDALQEIAMMHHANATDAEKLEACRRVALRALEGKP